MPSSKYAKWLNQWLGAHGLRQTNTRGHGYNSFFCYTGKCQRAERSRCLVMLIVLTTAILNV